MRCPGWLLFGLVVAVVVGAAVRWGFNRSFGVEGTLPVDCSFDVSDIRRFPGALPLLAFFEGDAQ